MREIMTVFKFTFKDALSKKALLISTAIILILIIVGTVVGSIVLKAVKEDEASPDSANVSESEGEYEASKTCYIINGDKIEGLNDMLRMSTVMLDTKFIDGDAAKIDEYKAEIEENPKTYMFEVTDGEIMPMLNFTTSSGLFDSTPPYDTISSLTKNYYVNSALANAGVGDDVIAVVMNNISYNVESLGGMDFTGYLVGIMLTVLIFLAVYYYGYGVAMSVAAEKTSRVMETLIMSAKPSHILIGKCIAMGLVGIAQMASILVVTCVCYLAAFKPYVDEMGIDIKLSSIGAGEIILVLVYFLVGYALYAMIDSVCGASVSRTEDINAALMPAMLISLVSFYVGYMGIFMAGEGFRKIVSIVPFTSPFIMPFRLLNDNVSPLEIILSLVLIAALTALVTVISVRLYTASVMYYGQRLKLKDMFKLSSDNKS